MGASPDGILVTKTRVGGVGTGAVEEGEEELEVNK
jgi:hypothetical protein